MASTGTAAGAPDDAELARRAAAGDRESFGLLFERWFDRSYDVAWHIVHNRDTAAEVAQDAFAAAWRQISELRQPESFGGWLLRITRNRGLNRLARERRSSPVGDHDELEATGTMPHAPPPPEVPEDRLVARERDDLVWAASVALGPDDASLLDLHLRHGLAPPELAEELGVQANAVHQRLFRLKRRLGEAVEAWVLWHGGRPACPDLGAALAGRTAAAFSRTTAAAIVRHARACPSCADDRQLRLSPEALFSAVPLVAAGPILRAQAAAALESAGVPVAETGPAPGGEGSHLGPSVGSGSPGEDPPGGLSRSPSGRERPARRWVALAAAATVVLVATVAAVAEQAGDGPDDAALTPPPAPGSTLGAPGTTGATTGTSSALPTSEPAAVAPTPSAPPPPTTTPETTTAPETTTTIAPPEISGFRAAPGAGRCATFDEVPVSFVWSTIGATSATLGPVGGAADAVEPSGSATRCTAAGSTWELTATGPGGSSSATATVPLTRG